MSVNEWIKMLWYMYTMEYSSVIKWNEFESFLVNWMKLEPVIQSEINQKEKKKILHQQMYVKFRKTVQMNLFAGQD